MDFTFDVFLKTRGFFKAYLEELSLAQLNAIPKGFNNNIIWNIGHSIVTEQILVYKLSGLKPNVSEALIEKYKKGTKPDGKATQAEVDELKKLAFSTIEHTNADFSSKVFSTYNEYTLSTTGNTLTNVNQAIQFSLIHEGMHAGYILALLRALKV
ncbi:MAG: DinB family protein [Lacinutrix sp.]|uniref:DinB family protein n=1 Tax=Lacinutrix sp. TaxID=1937692 RepID=UPI0030A73D9B